MKRLISLLLALAMVLSLSTGLSITTFAAGETVTATVQGTYTKSEDAQDITVRLEPAGLTDPYCMFSIDGITLPEGFAVKSFSTSNTAQPITGGNYNLSIGRLNYYTNDSEDTIPKDTYYDVVITVPANASGEYSISFNTIRVATTYGQNTVLEQTNATAALTISEPAAREYNITIDSNIQNGSVTASAAKAAAGTQVTLTADPIEGYELKKLTYIKNEEGADPVDVESSVPFEMPAADITVNAEFGLPYNGYYFTTSADTVPDEDNSVAVTVKVIGHSDNLETFNAYDLTVTYDSGLVYSNFAGTAAEDDVSVTNDENSNTIRVVGAGANKDIGTNVVTLKFTMAEDATGTNEVKVTAAKVSDRDASAVKDAPAAQAAADPNDPEADDTPDTTIVSTKYKVDKPEFVLVSGDAIHGKSLSFWYDDNDPTHFEYTVLKVTNGSEVLEDLIPDADDKFTIDEVEGNVLIEVTRNRKTYEVEIQTQNANVTVGKKEDTDTPIDASYGVDYAFGVTPNENMSISKVAYKIGGAESEVDCAYNQENNQYYVPGENIVGKVTILVEAAASGNINVEFSGSGSDLVAGGTSQNVPMGQELIVTLNEKKDGYLYSVRVGDNTIAANEDGTFTIPGNLVQAGLKVTVLEAKLVVNVVNYFDIDGKSLFLVKAKATAAEMGENETTENIDLDLAYGKDGEGELLPMYYSNKYTVIDQIPAEDGTTDVVSEEGAFAWLVFTDETLIDGNAIKTAAMAAITENTDGKSDAHNIAYDNNVNGSNNIDVNDAQLVYDMYKGQYIEFTDNLTMKKFLEADLSDVVTENGSLLNTSDVMVIIDAIIKAK